MLTEVLDAGIVGCGRLGHFPASAQTRRARCSWGSGGEGIGGGADCAGGGGHCGGWGRWGSGLREMVERIARGGIYHARELRELGARRW
jgi:hypothetical protein